MRTSHSRTERKVYPRARGDQVSIVHRNCKKLRNLCSRVVRRRRESQVRMSARAVCFCPIRSTLIIVKMRCSNNGSIFLTRDGLLTFSLQRLIKQRYLIERPSLLFLSLSLSRPKGVQTLFVAPLAVRRAPKNVTARKWHRKSRGRAKSRRPCSRTGHNSRSAGNL